MALNNLACFALLVVTLTVTLASANERTKTVEFNVKPGGAVHTFSEKMVSDMEKMREYECSFTYASQGGTNEQWLMSVGLSDDDSLFSCSVWRPQGKSYLFFTQFKAELKGAKIEYASAYSQTAAGGQRDVTLKEDEFTVGDSTVTHKDGKFRAELSKLTIIGRTRHDEL
ncbi:myeloid-derived growth factor isoform X2 [Coregonus clupeaformis]|uniref:myeloid-derived growth factor isoform X2 n=1 Tax=Coregonus clupeaformis TaxID=59861 RepID=UPI001E1C85AE|nr:myeloid-derived growth factor isoform X2 [Coregonus clupeaformis]